MQQDPRAKEVRQYLDRSLVIMREMRGVDRSERARRLSVAITQLEIACMCFNQSQFKTDQDYSPIVEE